MPIKKWIKAEYLVYIILSLFFLINLIYILIPNGVWWDSAVYIGMGKYIYSAGETGLWEASRPLVMPIVLGLLWKLKLNVVFWAKFINVFLSTACVYLTYTIAKKVFDKKTAVLSVALISSSLIFFHNTRVIQTEIPSLFLTLIGIYFLTKNQWILSGVSLSFAFMTRFFAIFAIIPVIIFVTYTTFKPEKRKTKEFLTFLIAFCIPLLLFLAINYTLYKNPVYPFTLQAYMTQNTGWMYTESWNYYFVNIWKESIFSIFAVLGILFTIKNRKPWQLLLLITLLFAFVPFVLEAHKELRFLITSLPFLYLFSAYGLSTITKLLGKWQNIVLLLIIAAWVIHLLPQYTFYSYEDNSKYFTNYAKENNVNGTVWISNPVYGLYSDFKADLIYYPTLNKEKILDLNSLIFYADYLMINTCDIPCHPKEEGCEERKMILVRDIKEKFRIRYTKLNDCELIIAQK